MILPDNEQSPLRTQRALLAVSPEPIRAYQHGHQRQPPQAPTWEASTPITSRVNRVTRANFFIIVPPSRIIARDCFLSHKSAGHQGVNLVQMAPAGGAIAPGAGGVSLQLLAGTQGRTPRLER